MAIFYYYYNEASYHSIAHLATEAHDDDGLPHTLEHLVFMGSENYPYKVKHIMYDKSNLHILYPALTGSQVFSKLTLKV